MHLRSAEQCPCYRHGKRCSWPSCSMNLPPGPTSMKLSSLNSLMRPSQGSISSKCFREVAGKPVQPAPFSSSIHFIQAKATVGAVYVHHVLAGSGAFTAAGSRAILRIVSVLQKVKPHCKYLTMCEQLNSDTE